MTSGKYIAAIACLLLLFPTMMVAQEAAGTSDARTVSEKDIERYPTTDIRNALTGLFPGLVIKEVSGAPGLLAFNDNSRSYAEFRMANPVIYVDGMLVLPGEINIDAEEIESVRLIRDVAEKASVGGTRGCDGIIWITTRKNSQLMKRVRAGFESGINMIDRMPEWVSDASEYATLFNQARTNSGYEPYYTQEQIDGYKSGNAYDLQYPSVDWRSLIYRKVAPFNKAFASLDGANGRFRYSAHLSYAGEGDFYAAGKTAGYNRFNLRTNVEADITKALSFHFGFYGGYSLRTQPLYGSSSSAFEIADFLNATNNIPSNSYPLLIDTDEATGIRTWGVSRLYANNPYASLLESGFYRDRTRTGIVNASLTFDMSQYVPGLSLDSYIALEDYTQIRLGSIPDYLAVIYDPETDTMTKTSHQGAKVSGLSTLSKRYRQGLYLRERISYEHAFDEHDIRTTAFFYLENTDRTGWAGHERQLSGVFTAAYSFRNKIFADVVLNVTGSTMFAKGHRTGFFPSLGLAYKINDNIRVRAQGGIIGGNTFYASNLYEDDYTTSTGVKYGPASTRYQWLGSATRYQGKDTRISRLGNPELTWEKRYEAVLGFDASLLKNRLSISAEAYLRDRTGIITNTTVRYPRSYGYSDTEIYENYNAYIYYGAGIALSWSDKVGDFQYSVGGDLNFGEGRYQKYCQVATSQYNNYEGALIGKANGYIYLGRFESQEEIDNSPQQKFIETVSVGDLKYEDRNGDNVVDSKDAGLIANTKPKLSFSLNLCLRYKGFEFSMVGTGLGAYDIILNNSYYWNGWGDSNYSAFVRDNIGGSYPSLQYEKNANNFVNSDYWVRNGSFFKIKNVELAYNFSYKKLKGMKVFLRGADLLTISGFKYTDPENINAGVTTYPFVKTFTCGAKMTF